MHEKALVPRHLPYQTLRREAAFEKKLRGNAPRQAAFFMLN